MDHENLIERGHSLTVKELTEMWDGRMPTWEEFKATHQQGFVRTDKSLALKFFWDVGVPKFHALLWGFVVPVGGALIILAAPIVLHFLWRVTYWLIPVIWIVGFWFLFKVSQESACEAVKHAAAKNQRIYDALVTRGAFLFEPSRGKIQDARKAYP
ncbi:MAG TPA: hypothetical protein VKB26_13545 [Candidatus Acidoferrales bacterium]|nr:hypothetical protein [Candidatus Acidoferrales bacterium]